jgi:hypothetical protein
LQICRAVNVVYVVPRELCCCWSCIIHVFRHHIYHHIKPFVICFIYQGKSCFFLTKTFPMKVLKRSKWSEILLPWYNPHLYWKKKPIRFIKPCKESIDNSLPGLKNATSKCYGSIIGMFRIVPATAYLSIVVFNTYCVVFLYCFSLSCVP